VQAGSQGREGQSRELGSAGQRNQAGRQGKCRAFWQGGIKAGRHGSAFRQEIMKGKAGREAVQGDRQAGQNRAGGRAGQGRPAGRQPGRHAGSQARTIRQ
jgi:hypothetical protein